MYRIFNNELCHGTLSYAKENAGNASNKKMKREKGRKNIQEMMSFFVSLLLLLACLQFEL